MKINYFPKKTTALQRSVINARLIAHGDFISFSIILLISQTLTMA